MDTAIEFYSTPRNLVFHCYQNTALDYFHRMGGPIISKGHEVDWPPFIGRSELINSFLLNQTHSL